MYPLPMGPAPVLGTVVLGNLRGQAVLHQVRTVPWSFDPAFTHGEAVGTLLLHDLERKPVVEFAILVYNIVTHHDDDNTVGSTLWLELTPTRVHLSRLMAARAQTYAVYRAMDAILNR